MPTWIRCVSTRCLSQMNRATLSWAFAHRGKWGQLTPWKMDEKLKSEYMQKGAVFYVCYILTAIRAGRCRERRCADHIFIQIYFRMHHFLVKIFFASGEAARGHWPPNQNPADVPGRSALRNWPIENHDEWVSAGPILRNFSGCTISNVYVWCNALTLSKVTTS